MVFWELGDREGRSQLDTTEAVPISVDKNFDVAFLSPFISPWVFDLPVGFVVLNSIAYHKHPVVKFGPALLIRKNSTFVQLESRLVGLDSHRNRLLCNCSSQSLLRSNWNLMTIWNRPYFIRFLIFAWRQFPSPVRIFTLRCNSMILYVPERVVHQSSQTSVISIFMWTIHKLLLWECGQLLSADEVCTFGWTSCGESPAGTALTLVFDCCYCTLFGPVYLVGQVQLRWSFACALVGVAESVSGGLGSGWEVGEVGCSKFLRSEVGEVVHLDLVGLKPSLEPSLMRLNKFQILKPDSQPVLILMWRVLFVVLLLPDLEIFVWRLCVVVEGVESYSCDGQEGQHCSLCSCHL